MKMLKQMVKKRLGISTMAESHDAKLKPEFRALRHAGHAMQKLLADYQFQSVLDIGSGDGQQAKLFLKYGKRVMAVDYGTSVQFEKRGDDYDLVKGDFMEIPFKETYDCIWASHVLEHIHNVRAFLSRLNELTNEGGVVCITVPPLKHQIVGGHVSFWNTGMLIYNLILSGFDCCEATALKYGYNITVIVKKKSIELPALTSGPGDLAKLRQYFPDTIAWNKSVGKDFGAQINFNGDIEEIRWW